MSEGQAIGELLVEGEFLIEEVGFLKVKNSKEVLSAGDLGFKVTSPRENVVYHYEDVTCFAYQAVHFTNNGGFQGIFHNLSLNTASVQKPREFQFRDPPIRVAKKRLLGTYYEVFSPPEHAAMQMVVNQLTAHVAVRLLDELHNKGILRLPCGTELESGVLRSAPALFRRRTEISLLEVIEVANVEPLVAEVRSNSQRIRVATQNWNSLPFLRLVIALSA